MGYKLAGCNVVGGVDIDQKMVDLYRVNHKPQISFAEGIIKFNEGHAEKLKGQIDILDGSPPCSSFSMAGSREKGWGKDKKFREGQEKQILDDLFFHFIETARQIQPRVVIAENVPGMLVGNAKGYVKAIVRQFREIGYDARIYLLCASRFGVPQRRRRVFFVAFKGSTPDMGFMEQAGEVFFSQIDEGDCERPSMLPCLRDSMTWAALNGKKNSSGYFQKLNGKSKLWNHIMAHPDSPLPTIASAGTVVQGSCKGPLVSSEFRKGQSFPIDYNFNGNDTQYVTGMSVPPYMTRAVAQAVIRGMKNA